MSGERVNVERRQERTCRKCDGRGRYLTKKTLKAKLPTPDELRAAEAREASQ